MNWRKMKLEGKESGGNVCVCVCVGGGGEAVSEITGKPSW